MKTVVVFQGGGALGAYASGAWEVLAPWLQDEGAELVALAGGSIGAVNAAAVAHRLHEPDLGAAALSALWREQIATPSLPFFGWPVGEGDWARTVRSWNGLLSGMLVGNRGLYRPCYAHWNPLAGLQRSERPFFERSGMQALLAQIAPGYASEGDPAQPLLAVAATEVQAGELELFDSDAQAITPLHLMASSALPALFEPVQIGEHSYWDGEMVRDAMLVPLMLRLRNTGRLREGEPVRLVTIEQLPRPLAAPPRSGIEIGYRVANLLQLAKLTPTVEVVADGSLQWLRIRRAPLAHDGISGQFDYSPERIEELMAQGRQACADALGLQVDAAA